MSRRLMHADVTPDDRKRTAESGAMYAAAVRMRNLLDQKTGSEKHTLRRYLLVLERRLRQR